uniref:Uncharacterized protein n=1 Tax=Anguilla anguilla TaxID=7936 RepID=A0A0E9UVY0_ANGAN
MLVHNLCTSREHIS